MSLMASEQKLPEQSFQYINGTFNLLMCLLQQQSVNPETWVAQKVYWAQQRMFLCSTSHHFLGYHESNKAWKAHFPFGGWLQVRWMMLSMSGCWKGKGAADPSTLAQASTACSQQGSSQKQGCPGPSDHPSARAEGARGKLQPKSELCSSCSNNNYQDTFLLPLITAGSGSCNIPSVFLLKHKLEREPWTEMKWPRGTRNCQLPGDKQRSLADKRDICWKQTPASCWACGCSRPPLSLDVKQNFHFAELWSWDKLGSGSHQMGKRVKPVTSTSTAARGKKISLVFQCVWYSSDLQWLPGPWRLGLATESHKKEFAKDHYSLAFRQAFSTGK